MTQPPLPPCCCCIVISGAMSNPAALLFDVNGTLFPADAAASAFRELGLPAMALEVRGAAPGRVN